MVFTTILFAEKKLKYNRNSCISKASVNPFWIAYYSKFLSHLLILIQSSYFVKKKNYIRYKELFLKLRNIKNFNGYRVRIRKKEQNISMKGLPETWKYFQ